MSSDTEFSTFELDMIHLDEVSKIRTGDVIYLNGKLYIFDGYSVPGFLSASISADVTKVGSSSGLKVVVRSIESFTIKDKDE